MQKKHYILIALVLGGLAVWYFFFRKGSGGVAGLKAAATQGLGPEDTAAYNKMVALFKAEADPIALDWMMPHVVSALDGTNANPIPPDPAIDPNKLSKAGAFLGVYAAAYHGGGTFNGKKPGDANYDVVRQAFNQKMYNIFNEFKTAQINKKLQA